MPADTLSSTFAALAHPTRREILERLAEGPATVKELSAPFSISGPAMAKHLRVLERAGLITRGRHAQTRPARIAPGPIREIAEWAERYRRVWESTYDRLDGYLQELRSQEGSRGDAV